MSSWSYSPSPLKRACSRGHGVSPRFLSPYPFVCLSHPVCRCMCVCASITHSCLSSFYVCMYSPGPFFLSFIRPRSPMTPVSFCFVALVGRVMFASVRAVHLHASAPFSLRDTTVSLSVFRQYVLCYVYACASVSLLRDSGLVFILCSCVLCIHHSTRCASREALTRMQSKKRKKTPAHMRTSFIHAGHGGVTTTTKHKTTYAICTDTCSCGARARS